MKHPTHKASLLLLLPFLSACIGLAPEQSNTENSSSIEGSQREESSIESSEGASESTQISTESAEISIFSSQSESAYSSESIISSESSASIESVSSFTISSSVESISSSIVSGEITLNQAKTMANALTGTPNSAGIYVSSTQVQTKGVCVAILDSTETAKDYGVSKPYKGLFMDAEGSMVIAMDQTQYNGIKNYVGKTDSVYVITGTLSLYKGNPEIVASTLSWQQGETMDYSAALNADSISTNLDEIKTSISSMPINDKGKGYGRIVKTRLTYIEELVQEILLFTDGSKIIQVHGDSKISNAMSKNHVYDVYAWETLFTYRPGLEKIAFVEVQDETPSTLPVGESITGTGLYAISYTKDRNTHSSAYENAFYTVRTFQGYVSYYIKDNAKYMVLRDTYSATAYSTYTAALNGKAIFVNNDTETGVYSEADHNRSFLYNDYALEDVQITITFVPYLLNTSHYWMAFAFSSTIIAA